MFPSTFPPPPPVISAPISAPPLYAAFRHFPHSTGMTPFLAPRLMLTLLRKTMMEPSTKILSLPFPLEPSSSLLDQITMGGSKGSSIATSSTRNLPMCGCKEVMRLWVVNTSENPKRKFWRCVNYEADEACKLFVWDDELETDNEVPNCPNTLPHRCNCYGKMKEMMKDMLKDLKDYNKEFAKDFSMDLAGDFAKEFADEFAKQFAKDFGKDFGKECVSKKVEKLKKKLDFVRSRNN